MDLQPYLENNGQRQVQELGGDNGNCIQFSFLTQQLSDTYYFMAEIYFVAFTQIDPPVTLMVIVNDIEVERWDVTSTKIHDKIAVIRSDKVHIEKKVNVTLNIVSGPSTHNGSVPRIRVDSIFWGINLDSYLAELQTGYNWSCGIRDSLVATARKVLYFLDNVPHPDRRVYSRLLAIINHPHVQTAPTSEIKFDEKYFAENYTVIKEGKIHYEIRVWVNKLIELEEVIIDVGNYVAKQPDFKLTSPQFIEQHKQLLPDFGEDIFELRRRNELLNNLEILLEKETITSIPSTLYLDINNTCNFRCRMCYQSKSHFLQGEISSQHMFKIMKMMPYFENITVAGLGEPLLSKNLSIFADQARKYHCASHLITNGSLIATRLDALKKFSKISISFDAASAPIFEAMRSRSNFKQILKNIELLRSEVPDAIICFSTVLSKINIDELSEIVEYGEKLGINEISITPIEHMAFLELTKDDQALFEQEFAKARCIAKRSHIKINNSIVHGTFKELNGPLPSKAELLNFVRELPLKKKRSTNLEKVYEALSSKDFNFYPDDMVFGKGHPKNKPLQPRRSIKNVEHIVQEPVELNINEELERINCQIEENMKELRGQVDKHYTMPYCLDPWKLAYIKSGGGKRLCCHADIHVGDMNGGGLEQSFNSPLYWKIRRSMFNKKDMPSGCIKCRAADRQMGSQSLLSLCKQLSVNIGMAGN